VVAGVPIPIFALGAEKLEHEIDALRLAQKAVEAGAEGVVFGRNVIQARDPDQTLLALKAVVQQGLAPEDAVEQFGLE
jgi:DhnA family fructose-bisphosphate aldolase class Ia